MRKLLLFLIFVTALLAQSAFCFAADNDEVEVLLSPFQPREITGKSFEEIKDMYGLVETDADRGGIIAFDVAENGGVAVITGERKYLTFYDAQMNLLKCYTSSFYMIGVRYIEEKLLVFDYDICVVYNTEANMELVAVYDITPETEGIRPYEMYNSVARENPKKQGEYIYYKSDTIISPSVLFGKKHQSMFLVREDKDGNREVLINRARYRIITVIIVIGIVAVAIFVNLCWIDYKYNVFNIFRERMNNKQ